MLIFFQIFNNGCPLFFVSVTLFPFSFPSKSCLSIQSVFFAFFSVFFIWMELWNLKEKKRRKKVQTYTCISIWMEAWRLIKLHFVWKTAVWGCCCVPRGWMECALGDSLWHPSARLAFCGSRKPDATRRRGVSTAAQLATFTPSTSEHRQKKKNNQKKPNPKCNVKKLHYSRKVVLWGLTFRWNVWRRWKSSRFSSAWPVCSSTSWVEHNRNQLLVMWPFRQSSSLMSECEQRDAEVQIVFEPGHVVVESRIRHCLCLWFLRFIMLFYAAGRVNCIHKLLEGQTKFTCNGYRPSFFFLVHSEISSQNKISRTLCEPCICSAV